jgi:serine protease Do
VATKAEQAPSDGEDILDFFRRQLPRRPIYAVGSGFIVDPAGYIITNNHVIDNAARITVTLESGEEFAAKIVGTDEETDLAVLKIEVGRSLPFLKFGDSDRAEVGDWVLAVGSPFGLSKTVTAGIISQTRRETPNSSAFQKFIQTDAAINRGNSGGPLVNMDGEVIGVNSQIATSTGDYNGIGFALPSDEASNVYKQIVANGRVRRGYLGARLDSVKAEFAKVYGLKDARGAIVIDVRDKQSAAGVAGLQAGDVIISFNGKRVENAVDLISKVAGTPPDQVVNIEYYREAGPAVEQRTATLRLRERPTANRSSENDSRSQTAGGQKTDERPFGLTLAEITPTLATTYKLEGQTGLLIKSVNPASFIADVRLSTGDAALGEGDLIQRMNRVTVIDLKTFSEAVAKLKPGDAVVLQVVSYDPRARGPQLKIVQFTVR